MYAAINVAVAAHNALASERGLPGLSLDRVIEQCGVSPETFTKHCNGNGAEQPELTPKAEERARAVLQDIESQTAALRVNGADRDAAADNAIVVVPQPIEGDEGQEDKDEDEDPHEGLAEGFWRENGVIKTIVGTGRNAYEAHLCSDMRAVRKVSAGDGMDWAVIVKFKDSRKVDKEARVSCGDAVTEPSKCIHELASAGLLIHVEDPKLFRIVLKSVLHADVPLAYRLARAGWFPIGAAHVFALPPRVIPRVEEEVTWGGDLNYCRTLQRGSMSQWKETVLAFANGNWVLMACIGVMLASPAILFLPTSAEVNTIVHLVNTTSLGKTLALRGGASNWGEGSDPAMPTSFIEPWKTTGNASENLLAAYNHIGFCLDEMKSVDAKAAGSFAYDYALGRGKDRMNRDRSSRRRLAWANFGLSAGEITLTERASETSSRSQPGDAGAEARVINIMPEVIFEDWHGCSSAKEVAVKFGVMCIENCGWSGPAYVEWLASHGDEARVAIVKNLAAWNAIAALLLGVDPSPQAERVASRLGPMAAGSALAAEVLEFPWSAELPVQGGEFIAAPARAMIKAFAGFLGIWLANNGVTVSTQVNQAFDQLRNYYHSAPGAAFIVVGLKDEDGVGNKIARAQSDIVPLLGWKVYRDLVTEIDSYGRERPVSGVLEYVDFKPDVFKQRMGWTKVTFKTTLRTLRDQGLLLSAKPDELQHRRRVDGKISYVIRVKSEFFGDEDEGAVFPTSL